MAVLGGYFVTVRAIALGDVQAFMQYSRQFSMPITQLSSMANAIQMMIASAERVFELLDEPEELLAGLFLWRGAESPAQV